MTTLHLHAYWNGHSDRCGGPTNIYRDVLDLALELQRQLGLDAQDMSAPQLKTAVEEEGARMSVRADTLPLSRSLERAATRQAESGNTSRVGS